MCVLVSDLLSKTGLSEFGCLLPLGVDSHFWLPAWFPCTPFRVHGVWDNQAGSQKWIPTRNASNPLNSDNPIVETKSNTRKHMHTPTQCKIFTRIFWYWKTYKILVNMPLVFFFNFFFRGRPKQSSFSKQNKAFTFFYPPSPLEPTNQLHHYYHISFKIYIIILSCTKTEHIVSDPFRPLPPPNEMFGLENDDYFGRPLS